MLAPEGWARPGPHPTFNRNDHHAFMDYALQQAQLSPPAPTKFCVGAVLVDSERGTVISTGYSTELPGQMDGDAGNTHAEQVCFMKVAQSNNLSVVHAEDHISNVLPTQTILYTTMEPCNERLSGSTTCVDRILRLKGVISAVYIGIREPDTFIQRNDGIKRLQEAGIEAHVLDDMRERVICVTMAGHEVGGDGLGQ